MGDRADFTRLAANCRAHAAELKFQAERIRQARIARLPIEQFICGAPARGDMSVVMVCTALTDIAPDVYRVAELRLASEARKFETRARVLMSAADAAKET